MTSQESAAETFEGTLSARGNNTGIEVPEEVVERLGRGKRPPVLVDLNGYEYLSTVAVMGGTYLVPVSAAIRAATGLAGGDPIRVTLRIAERPEVQLPTDFAEALAVDPAARAFFDGLSESLQRYHVDTVESAKTPETRQRRIEKATSLFLEGKKR
jgi:hypothetical protein